MWETFYKKFPTYNFPHYLIIRNNAVIDVIEAEGALQAQVVVEVIPDANELKVSEVGATP